MNYTTEYKPNTIKTFNVGKESYIITSNKYGELNAFYNVCSHRGCRLIPDGKYNNTNNIKDRRRITCPYHHFSYDLNGNLKAQPMLNKKNDSLWEMNKDKYHLKNINIDIWNGMVFVNPNISGNSNNIPDLHTQFGSLNTELSEYKLNEYTFYTEKIYDNIQTNWKIVNENFLEWYHVPTVHPSLAPNSTAEAHIVMDSNDKMIHFCTDPITNNGSVIDLNGQLNINPYINDKLKQRLNFFYLYPNTIGFLHPTHMVLLYNYPINTNETYERLIFIQHPTNKLDTDTLEEHQIKMDKIVNYWKVVNDEDIDICQQQFKGVRSNGFKNGGYYSSNMEINCHRFHEMIIKSVTN